MALKAEIKIVMQSSNSIKPEPSIFERSFIFRSTLISQRAFSVASPDISCLLVTQRYEISELEYNKLLLFVNNYCMINAQKMDPLIKSEDDGVGGQRVRLEGVCNA